MDCPLSKGEHTLNTPLPRATPLFSALFLLFSSPVFAQQAPPSLDAGQLLKQEQINKLPPTPTEEEILFERPPAAAVKPAKSLADDSAVLVKFVRFTGAVAVPESKLAELIQPSLNKTLSFTEIQGLASQLARYYRAQGYFLAQVLVPAQDISDGNLTFKVIEGRLSQRASRIAASGQKRTSTDRLTNTLLAPLTENAGLNESELERGILVLNDLPGIRSTVTVEPGEEPETARLLATVKEGPLFRGSVTLDNAGNRYTGAFRTGLNVYADNLTGQGDQAAIQASKAVNGDFAYGRLAYSRPVGYNGLILGLSAFSVDYTSGKELESLDAQGNAESFVFSAQYPLIRSRSSNLALSTSFENRSVSSQTLGIPVTDKRFDVSTLGLSGDYTDARMGGGISSAAVLLTHGRLDLDRLPGALAADQGINGSQTQGEYAKLNVNVTRLQSLTSITVGQLSLSGQYAKQNLDSGEKISLGGPSGLKAYPAGEALGDRGLVVGAEVRTVLAKSVELAGMQVGDIQFSAFYDAGRVTQFDQAPATLSTPKSYHLRDVGVGFNIGSAGVYDMRIYLARALGDNPGADINGKDSNGRSSKTRLIVFTTIYF